MSQCWFWIQQMVAGRAEQIYGRPSMVIVHFGLRASGESGIERYPKRNGPSGPLAALAGPLSSNRHLSVVSPQDRGGQQYGPIERRPNRYGTGHDDRRSQRRYRRRRSHLEDDQGRQVK